MSSEEENIKKQKNVKFAETTFDFIGEEDEDEDSDEFAMQGVNLDKLTNKKKQYLMNQIIDKNGAYSYLEDPTEYKKARKRLQNRESAVRSRQRKKNYQEILEAQIDDQKLETDIIVQQKKELEL